MLKMRPSVFLLTLIFLGLSAGTAVAQTAGDAPYTPRTYQRAELINLGTYDTPPIQFQWPVTEVRQMPVGHRLDFVMTLDANPSEVIAFFENGLQKKSDVATLAPNILPFQTSRKLRVIGKSLDAMPVRFTLGGQGSYRFVIDVSPSGRQTQLVLQNIMVNQLFSGVVPARAPFEPEGAKPVNFLWN